MAVGDRERGRGLVTLRRPGHVMPFGAYTSQGYRLSLLKIPVLPLHRGSGKLARAVLKAGVAGDTCPEAPHIHPGLHGYCKQNTNACCLAN